MREFELITKILHDRFLAVREEGAILEETKECRDHGVHRIKLLRTKPIDNTALYRFSLDDEDFLPFYKDSREYPDGRSEGGPKGLKKFCDYILLVEHNDRLTVVLVEMKRSKKDTSYRDQLDASEIFMNYVTANAERIKNRNDFDDFDSESISYRKVKIVHDPTCDKLTTKPRNKVLSDGRDGYVILPLGKQFNPSWVI